MPTSEILLSSNYVVRFYRAQLKKFEDIGIGKTTENGVRVTKELIKTTRKRLAELTFKRVLHL